MFINPQLFFNRTNTLDIITDTSYFYFVNDRNPPQETLKIARRSTRSYICHYNINKERGNKIKNRPKLASLSAIRFLSCNVCELVIFCITKSNV